MNENDMKRLTAKVVRAIGVAFDKAAELGSGAKLGWGSGSVLKVAELLAKGFYAAANELDS